LNRERPWDRRLHDAVIAAFHEGDGEARAVDAHRRGGVSEIGEPQAQQDTE
jgi:hypothetical protein